MRSLVVAIAAFLCGCANTYIETGIGYDSYIEQGSNPRSVIRFRKEHPSCFDTRGTCALEFNHHSSILDGYPFNGRAEQLVNQWSFIYRYPLGEERR